MGLQVLIKKTQKGQSLVELLIVIGLFVVIAPAILTGFVSSREARPQRERRLESLVLLREAEEALRTVREEDWANIDSNITMGSAYHPEIFGSTWTLVSGSETVNTAFTRQIVINDVQRDSGGAIVASGGTVDDSTKAATITVSWTEPIAASSEATVYLTRSYDNDVWSETSQSNFDSGTFTNTVSTTSSGGEVELDQSSGGSGDWATPVLEGSYDNSGNDDAQGVFVDGAYAYWGRSSGSGDDFIIMDISDPSNVSKEGGADLGGTGYDIYVSGNYAYVATSNNSQELQVFDISDKTNPTEIDNIDLGDKRDAYSVYGTGNYIYVGKDASGGGNREIYIIDVSDPNNISEVGSIELGDDVNDIKIAGNYMYIATDGTEFLIYDISSPTSPSSVGSYDAPSGSDGEGVFVDDANDRAYLVTRSSSGSEFYIIDISSKSSPSLIGSFDIGNHANNVWVVCDLAFIANDQNSSVSITILDISSEGSPVLYGTYDNSSDVYDLAVSADGAYLYAATTNNASEFLALSGGGGSCDGSGYLTSGTFESQSFDAGSEVAFNYLTHSFTEPANQDLNLQYAVNNDDTTWNFIGPDGTGGTYFEDDGQIPLGSIKGRYFRYKVYFTGDGSDTPVFEDFSVNYSL